jgi:hypothetical protein
MRSGGKYCRHGFTRWEVTAMMKTSKPRLMSIGLVAICGLGICTPATAGKYLLDEIKPIWAKLDVDRDGFISKSEIRDEDPQLVAGFDQADFDKDGYLGLRELEFLLISS